MNQSLGCSMSNFCYNLTSYFDFCVALVDGILNKIMNKSVIGLFHVYFREVDSPVKRCYS